MITALFVTLIALQSASSSVKNSTDLTSVDGLIADLYSVISGPAGQPRDWDEMRRLFLPSAQMGMVYQTRSGEPREFDFDVEKYIALSGPSLEKDGFFEKEIGRRTDRFDRIAQVFSSYASVHKLGEKSFESGSTVFNW